MLRNSAAERVDHGLNQQLERDARIKQANEGGARDDGHEERVPSTRFAPSSLVRNLRHAACIYSPPFRRNRGAPV